MNVIGFILVAAVFGAIGWYAPLLLPRRWPMWLRATIVLAVGVFFFISYNLMVAANG